MEKEFAVKFLPFVNDPDNMRDFVSLLNYRIEYYKKQLVEAKDIDEVRRYQGAINALTYLTEIRQRVLDYTG